MIITTSYLVPVIDLLLFLHPKCDSFSLSTWPLTKLLVSLSSSKLVQNSLGVNSLIKLIVALFDHSVVIEGYKLHTSLWELSVFSMLNFKAS